MTTSMIRSTGRSGLADIFRRTAEQLSLPLSRRRHRFFRRLQVEPLEERRPLAAGSLDSSFDGDGIAITSLSTWLDEANNVAVQWDGKIVAAGTAYAESRDDLAVVGTTRTAFGYQLFRGWKGHGPSAPRPIRRRALPCSRMAS